MKIFQKLLLPKMPVTEAASTVVPPSPKKLKLDDSKLQVAKLTENATLPTRGSPLAAGYDLYSAEVKFSAGFISVNQTYYRTPPSLREARVSSRLISRSASLTAPTAGWLRGLASPGSSTSTSGPGWWTRTTGAMSVRSSSGINTNSYKRGHSRCCDVQPRGHRVRGEEGRQNRPAGL